MGPLYRLLRLALLTLPLLSLFYFLSSVSSPTTHGSSTRNWLPNHSQRQRLASARAHAGTAFSSWFSSLSPSGDLDNSQATRAFQPHWNASRGALDGALSNAQYTPPLSSSQASLPSDGGDDDRGRSSEEYRSRKVRQEVDRDDTLCRGWQPKVSDDDLAREAADEKAIAAGCWRVEPYRLVEDLLEEETLMEHFGSSQKDLLANAKALGRLLNCLGDVDNTLECPAATYRVLLLSYYHAGQAFSNRNTDGRPSGETIWMVSQLDGLDQAGYTVLSTGNSYQAMIKLYRYMPDLISRIWASEEHIMTCQHDPRCLLDFRPTRDAYQGFELDPNGDAFWGSAWEYEADAASPSVKWIWHQEEIESIPDDERGIIPLHKMHAVTFFSHGPGTRHWWTPSTGSQFSLNSLGSEWTIAPYSYPDHTWLPMSIEAGCPEQAPEDTHKHLSGQEKRQQAYVFTKNAKNFYGSLAPGGSVWKEVSDELDGLKLVTSVTDADEYPLPPGLMTLPSLDSHQFRAEVAASKLMIGIGRPGLSPSPYDALCQGTPVALPVHLDEPPTNEWQRYSIDYTQHYPALTLGEPYVYGYRPDDHQSLINVIRKAIDNPIGRYIPHETTMASVAERLTWFMEFDWETLAERRMAELPDGKWPITQAFVQGRCHEIGRCRRV